MKALSIFSVFGLRFFQNGLLLIGLGLIPLVIFTEGLTVRFVCGLFLVSIFIGFMYLEKAVQEKYRLKEANSFDGLYSKVYENLLLFETLLLSTGIEKSDARYSLLGNIKIKLDLVTTEKELSMISNQLENEVLLLTQLQEMHKAKREQLKRERIKQEQAKKERIKRERAEKERKGKERTSVSTPNPITKHLEVLGLSKDTKDMIVIKKAYKNLIKTYHPDINPSPEAGQKVVEINLAFEEVKKHMKVS